jgi:alkylation response protein AidB-like acyl-CoA dehydrogenase
MVTHAEAARVSTWHAAVEQDADGRHRAAASARLLAAEAAVDASRRALQVLGARASVQGSRVERLYRDAKMLEVHGDPNEQQLRVVARHLVPDLVGADDPEA